MPAPAVTFAESALAALEASLAWYAEQNVPAFGRRRVGEIHDRVQAPRNPPELGREVAEFDPPVLREPIHPPFRLVHRRAPKRLRVVRVWRSARLLRLPADGHPQP